MGIEPLSCCLFQRLFLCNFGVPERRIHLLYNMALLLR